MNDFDAAMSEAIGRSLWKWAMVAEFTVADIAEIGLACMVADCHAIATVRTTWPRIPGDPPHRCCSAHADGQVRIAEAMGFALELIPIPVLSRAQVPAPVLALRRDPDDPFVARVAELEVLR